MKRIALAPAAVLTAVCGLFVGYVLRPAPAEVGAATPLDVIPSRHQTVSSANGGGVHTFIYELRNNSGQPLGVELVSKSCDCLDVSLESTLLDARSHCAVLIAGRVPDIGTSEGSVVLSLQGAKGTGASRQEIRLTYELRAEVGPGIHVAPRELQLRTSSITGKYAVSVLANTDAEPESIRAAWASSGRAIELRTRTSWSKAPVSGWSTHVELIVPREEATLGASIDLFVGGPSFMQTVRLPFVDEPARSAR